MNRLKAERTLRRALLPVVVFIAVLGVHYLWLGLFLPQTKWVAIGPTDKTSWLRRYIETQSYWLGLSYALSLAFASVCLRKYREERSCGADRLAIGGVTLSGTLAVAGCYLLGCCGSPMLAVYLSLFGAAFLPFAKPLVFAFTVGCLVAAWWRINRRRLPMGDCDKQDCCRAGLGDSNRGRIEQSR